MDDLWRYRALWAVSAMLLSFAGDGLSNLSQVFFGANGLGYQAGMIGAITLGAVVIELYARANPPKVKPKAKPRRRKPKPPTA